MSRSIKFEEPRIGIQLWTRWVDGPLTCLDFSPVHHWTALGYEDGTVQMVDNQGAEAWTAGIDVPVHHVRVADLKKRVITLDEHSRLVYLDLKGNVLKKVNFDQYWTSFELKSNAVVVWGWRAPPRKLDYKGKSICELDIPKPWRVVRALSRDDLYFVVHNQVTLGVYSGDGKEFWSVNHPVAIDLSRENPSEVSASENGERVAVSCFEKGVYVYDIKHRELLHVDLDAMASRVSVSGDGCWMLLADALGKIYLVDRQATIVWQKQMASKVYFCKLDREGDRAVVLEENGNLTCFEFTDSSRERTEFLEIRTPQDVLKPRQIWARPAPHFEGNWTGILKLSADGRFILFGIHKNFYLYDAEANRIWEKSFMVRREDGWISDSGDTVLLGNGDEVYCAHPLTGEENHLTFYPEGVREVGFDPAGNRFLVLHKNGGFSLYNGSGNLMWKRKLDREISKIRLNMEKKVAVFQGMGKTLYTLNLQSLRPGKIFLQHNVARLRLNQGSIYAGDEAGTCYGIDYQGHTRWTHALGEAVERIIPLDQGVAFLSASGRVAVFQDDGVPLGEARLKHRRSVVAMVANEILEVAPEGKSVGCYRLLEDERIWQQELPNGVQALAVGHHGNRLAVLSERTLHFFRLLDLPETESGRAAWLEF